MNVTKEAGVSAVGGVKEQDLELINALSRKRLTAEEVYTFAVRLCDNEIDRDGERFEAETLEQLAKLFVGKSGIFDHQWSARGQAARIYRTELVREKHLPTAAGDGYCYVKGWAYMLRTEGNEELIAQIEGGIKKEVSVGCAVEQVRCSVCGEELGVCGHQRGQMYEGKLCYGQLVNATDAYEWSFVAVPAQKKAGVMKSMKQESKELEQLKAEAALGRRYLKELRREVARLGGLAECGLEAPVLEGIAEKLEEPELLALKQAYEARLKSRWPMETQLTYHGDTGAEQAEDGAFLI